MKKIKKYTPSIVLNVARRLRSSWFNFCDSFKPYLNKIKYLGFDVYYARGEGLINRIRVGATDRVYERDLVEAIVHELTDKSGESMIDIGANIGLISLAVFRSVPTVNIFAFEPGPHQHDLLATTILANQLNESIVLSGKAVSDLVGEAPFHVHDYVNSSGDGLVDTGRAGKSQIVLVETVTLDTWWNKNNRPHISVVKIDIEGGELLALRGAHEFISNVRPVIFTEISAVNIAAYNYMPQDYLDYFVNNNYELTTLSGKRCNHDNFNTLIEETDIFVAKPCL